MKKSRILALLLALVLALGLTASVFAKEACCPGCEGSGEIICSVCHGSRETDCPDCRECGICGGGGLIICPDCGGSGDVLETCSSCGGTGEGWDYEGGCPCPCDDCGGCGSIISECGRCAGGLASCGCDGGYVRCGNCNNGKIECTACEGTGKSACSICGGTGIVSLEDSLSLEDLFFMRNAEGFGLGKTLSMEGSEIGIVCEEGAVLSFNAPVLEAMLSRGFMTVAFTAGNDTGTLDLAALAALESDQPIKAWFENGTLKIFVGETEYSGIEEPTGTV